MSTFAGVQESKLDHLGAYRTHFWVDPKEELIGILMVQIQQAPGIRQQFQLLASAAIVD